MTTASIFILGAAAGLALGNLLFPFILEKKMKIKCMDCRAKQERKRRRHE